MPKPAPAQHSIHDLIRDRYSPRAFGPQSITPETLRQLFEAARWAPSSGNEQPWSYIVARREDPDAFATMTGVLSESNQRWAPKAPVLMISVTRLVRKNGKPYRHAHHDAGLALENLLLQATALGLAIHPMGGFSVEDARERYGIPPDHEPMAAIAVGYPGDPESLPDDLREREKAPRVREPIASFVFGAAWGTPHEVVSAPAGDAPAR